MLATSPLAHQEKGFNLGTFRLLNFVRGIVDEKKKHSLSNLHVNDMCRNQLETIQGKRFCRSESIIGAL